MPHFFKPLRRKIGMLTLMLACVLAGAWLRSRIVKDIVSFRHPPSTYFLTSAAGRVRGDCYADAPNSWVANTPTEWKTHPLDSPYGWNPVRDRKPKPDWLGLKFATGRINFSSGSLPHQNALTSYASCELSYWPIVFPLTVLSAWLLLSKTRKAEALPMADVLNQSCP